MSAFGDWGMIACVLGGLAKQFKVSLVISSGNAESDSLSLETLEVDEQPGTEALGLGLAGAKMALARLQAQIVTHQIKALSASHCRCQSCGLNRAIKDYHDVRYCSRFGVVVVDVPRRLRCECSCGTAQTSPASLGVRPIAAAAAAGQG
jgi:hypothetical protein